MKSAKLITLITLLITSTLTFAGPLESFGRSLDDGTITTKIKTKLTAEKISPTQVHVNTNDGVVVLHGTVDTKEEFEKVITIAQSTDGVVNVKTNELKVKDTGSLFADSVITSKIKGLLIKNNVFGDSDVSAWSVNVSTTAGVVTLTGSVASERQKQQVIDLAKSVENVKRVDSQLVVQ